MPQLTIKADILHVSLYQTVFFWKIGQIYNESKPIFCLECSVEWPANIAASGRVPPSEKFHTDDVNLPRIAVITVEPAVQRFHRLCNASSSVK